MMFRRIGLFVLTNILIIATITIVTSLLGVNRYLEASGINYTALLVFCLVWGFAGAFISLLLSKVMAKWTMGLTIIDPKNPGEYSWLVKTVHQLSQKAGLDKMPEVGIYESPEINAFATGPSRSNSLVAVSSGILQSMKSDELEGVLGHEVAHIANGDMVTMTLLQGVVNAFVMFFARVAAFAVAQLFRRSDGEGNGVSGMVSFVLVMVFQVVFGILGSMVTAAFSRYREFHADHGGAQYAGKQKMIGALQRLQLTLDKSEVESQPAMASFKISTKPNGFLALFSTHPPLEKRIAALQAARDL